MILLRPANLKSVRFDVLKRFQGTPVVALTIDEPTRTFWNSDTV